MTDKTIEELEHEYAEELNKKTARMKAEETELVSTEAEKAKADYEAGLKATWQDEYIAANPPDPKINTQKLDEKISNK